MSDDDKALNSRACAQDRTQNVGSAHPNAVKGPWFDVPAGTPEAECRSCQATVFWIRTAAGKPMPVDCDAEGGRWPFNGPATLEGAYAGRGISHFATCPQAGQWRHR